MTSHLKKVLYKKFNKEVVYFYDDEENYIIENKNDKDNVFDTYLSECESDNTKFDRNIKINHKISFLSCFSSQGIT